MNESEWFSGSFMKKVAEFGVQIDIHLVFLLYLYMREVA